MLANPVAVTVMEYVPAGVPFGFWRTGGGGVLPPPPPQPAKIRTAMRPVTASAGFNLVRNRAKTRNIDAIKQAITGGPAGSIVLLKGRNHALALAVVEMVIVTCVSSWLTEDGLKAHAAPLGKPLH